ncbi:hypothetical protein BKI52_44045 [marine bacterium AO1-C]|nr:hypothetical protein BKI52_44045 [marine bacterium AO1-C]
MNSLNNPSEVLNAFVTVARETNIFSGLNSIKTTVANTPEMFKVDTTKSPPLAIQPTALSNGYQKLRNAWYSRKLTLKPVGYDSQFFRLVDSKDNSRVAKPDANGQITLENNSNDSLWKMVPVPGKGFMFQSRTNNNLVLSIEGASLEEDANVRIDNLTTPPGAHQQWRVLARTPHEHVPFNLLNAANHQSIEAGSGNLVSLEPSSDSSIQDFSLTAVETVEGITYYKITNFANKNVLTIFEGNIEQQVYDADNDYHKWQFILTHEKTFIIKSKAGNYVLALDETGDKLIQTSESTNINQQWKLALRRPFNIENGGVYQLADNYLGYKLFRGSGTQSSKVVQIGASSGVPPSPESNFEFFLEETINDIEYYRIMLTGKVLTEAGGEGTEIELADSFANTDTQKWQIIYQSGGCSIQSKSSRLAIGINGFTNALSPPTPILSTSAKNGIGNLYNLQAVGDTRPFTNHFDSDHWYIENVHSNKHIAINEDTNVDDVFQREYRFITPNATPYFFNEALNVIFDVQRRIANIVANKNFANLTAAYNTPGNFYSLVFNWIEQNPALISALDIAGGAKQSFVNAHYAGFIGGTDDEKKALAGDFYDSAAQIRSLLMYEYFNTHKKVTAGGRDSRANNLGDTAHLPASYQLLFGPENHVKVDHDESITSPAAYLVELDDLAKKFILNKSDDSPYDINTRRPDLINTPLTKAATNTETTTLKLVQGVLGSFKQAKFPNERYPAFGEIDTDRLKKRTALGLLGTDLATWYNQADRLSLHHAHFNYCHPTEYYHVLLKSSTSYAAIVNKTPVEVVLDRLGMDAHAITSLADVTPSLFMQQAKLHKTTLEEAVYGGTTAEERGNVLPFLYTNNHLSYDEQNYQGANRYYLGIDWEADKFQLIKNHVDINGQLVSSGTEYLNDAHYEFIDRLWRMVLFSQRGNIDYAQGLWFISMPLFRNQPTDKQSTEVSDTLIENNTLVSDAGRQFARLSLVQALMKKHNIGFNDAALIFGHIKPYGQDYTLVANDGTLVKTNMLDYFFGKLPNEWVIHTEDTRDQSIANALEYPTLETCLGLAVGSIDFGLFFKHAFALNHSWREDLQIPAKMYLKTTHRGRLSGFYRTRLMAKMYGTSFNDMLRLSVQACVFYVRDWGPFPFLVNTNDVPVQKESFASFIEYLDLLKSKGIALSDAVLMTGLAQPEAIDVEVAQFYDVSDQDSFYTSFARQVNLTAPDKALLAPLYGYLKDAGLIDATTQEVVANPNAQSTIDQHYAAFHSQARSRLTSAINGILQTHEGKVLNISSFNAALTPLEGEFLACHIHQVLNDKTQEKPDYIKKMEAIEQADTQDLLKKVYATLKTMQTDSLGVNVIGNESDNTDETVNGAIEPGFFQVHSPTIFTNTAFSSSDRPYGTFLNKLVLIELEKWIKKALENKMGTTLNEAGFIDEVRLQAEAQFQAGDTPQNDRFLRKVRMRQVFYESISNGVDGTDLLDSKKLSNLYGIQISDLFPGEAAHYGVNDLDKNLMTPFEETYQRLNEQVVVYLGTQMGITKEQAKPLVDFGSLIEKRFFATSTNLWKNVQVYEVLHPMGRYSSDDVQYYLQAFKRLATLIRVLDLSPQQITHILEQYTPLRNTTGTQDNTRAIEHPNNFYITPYIQIRLIWFNDIIKQYSGDKQGHMMNLLKSQSIGWEDRLYALGGLGWTRNVFDAVIRRQVSYTRAHLYWHNDAYYPQPPMRRAIDAIRELFSLKEFCESTGLEAQKVAEAQSTLSEMLLAIKAKTPELNDASDAVLLANAEEQIRDHQVTEILHYCRLIPELQHISNTNQLSEHLLTDVAVSSQVSTSPVKFAISAYQTLINRTLQGLEEDLKITSHEAELIWEWSKHYRTWEANRKVYLYPENYLDPQLLSGASGLYKKFVGDINAAKINEDTIEQAYKAYLNDWVHLQQMEIIEARFAEGGDVHPPRVYLLSKSRSDTTKSYLGIVHLKNNGQGGYDFVSMDAWQPIDALGAGAHPTVCYEFGRIFIFFLEFSSYQDVKIGSNTYSGFKTSIKYTTLNLSGRFESPTEIGSIICRHKKTTNDERIALDDFVQAFTKPNAIFEFGVKPTYQGDKFAVYLHADPDFLKNAGEIHHPWYVHADLSVTHEADTLRENQILVWGNEGNNQNSSAYTNAFPGNTAFVQDDSDQTLRFKAPDEQASHHGGPYSRVGEGSFYLKKAALAHLGLVSGNTLVENKEIFISFWFRIDSFDFGNANKTILAQFTMNGSITNGRWELTEQGDLYFQVDGKYDAWWKFKEQLEPGVWYHLAYQLSPTGGTIHLHHGPVLYRFKNNRLDRIYLRYPADEYARRHGLSLNNHYYQKYQFNGGDNKSAYILSSHVSAFHRFDMNTSSRGLPHLADPDDAAHNKGLSFDNLVVRAQSSKAYDNLDFRVLKGKKKSNKGEWYLEIKVGEQTNTNNESEYQMIRLTAHVANTWGQSLNLPAQNFVNVERQFEHSGHFDHDFIHEDSDHLKYPVALRPADDHIDFNSANGIYYNEIFMWMPLLAAKLYNQQGEYAQAQKWLRKVFNPSLTTERLKEGSKFKAHLSPDQPNDIYWQYIRLWARYNTSLSDVLFNDSSSPKDISKAFGNQDTATQVYYEDPFDPAAIADLHPKAYQEMVVKQYVQNLIDWGDSLYRQLTRESLTEAYMFYEEAYELLGLDSLNSNENTFQHGEEVTLGNKPLHKLHHEGKLWEGLQAREIAFTQAQLPTISHRETLHSSAYSHVSALYFGIASNHQIDQVWQTLKSRFFNLRHHLDINGNPLHLPLFQPSISPANLIRAKANGQLSQALANGGITQAPHHRFYTQLGLAREFTQLVARFGDQLLTAIREHDNERLANLSLGHQGVILQQMKEIKAQQVKVAENDRDSLEKQIEATLLSKAFVNGLRQSYIGAWEADAGIFAGLLGGMSGGLAGAALLADGISRIESQAKQTLEDYSENDNGRKVTLNSTVKVRQAFASFALENASLVANALAAGLQTAAAISHLVAAPLSGIPTIFGFSNGGFKPQDVANSLGTALGSTAFASQFVGSSLREVATHLMRDQEWEHQNEQLDIQLKQLTLHYESVSRHVRIAKMDQQLNQTYIDQHDEMIRFYQGKQAGKYQGKFTNEALYRWMQGKLTSLYKQAYGMAVDQALKTQSALEYEKGLTPGALSGMVVTNSWDANHNGLLAAEPLLLSLQRLEQRHLEEDKRRMEITEVFSLAKRFRNEDGTYGETQKSSFHEYLVSQRGVISFGFGEKSSHYNPQDKIDTHDFDKYYSGHYCRQIKLVTVSVPSLLGPYKMLHGTLEQTSNLLYTERNRSETSQRTVAAPCKKIALSMAMGESGVHSGSGGGGYLPFEGTGVDSAWALTLKDLDTVNVNDIIITMHYTVRE